MAAVQVFYVIDDIDHKYLYQADAVQAAIDMLAAEGEKQYSEVELDHVVFIDGWNHRHQIKEVRS